MTAALQTIGLVLLMLLVIGAGLVGVMAWTGAVLRDHDDER